MHAVPHRRYRLRIHSAHPVNPSASPAATTSDAGSDGAIEGAGRTHRHSRQCLSMSGLPSWAHRTNHALAIPSQHCRPTGWRPPFGVRRGHACSVPFGVAAAGRVVVADTLVVGQRGWPPQHAGRDQRLPAGPRGIRCIASGWSLEVSLAEARPITFGGHERGINRRFASCNIHYVNPTERPLYEVARQKGFF